MKRRWYLLLGLPFLALAGVVVGVEREIDRRWEAFSVEIKSRVEDARARVSLRPALNGETLPGNAWEHYENAITASAVLDEDRLSEIQDGSEHVDHEALRLVLVGTESAVDELRLGARSERANWPYAWELGVGAPMPELSGSRRAMNVALAHVELLRGDGRQGEACELLLDALQYARDHTRDATLIGEMVGLSLQSAALERLVDVLERDEASPESAARLADALGTLDEEELDRRGFANDSLALAVTLVEPGAFDSPEVDLDSRLAAWRQLMSPRLMVLDYWKTAEELSELTSRLRDEPWVTAEPRLEAWEAGLGGNLIVALALPQTTSAESAWRRADAQLRLARAAANLRAGRGFETRPDPLGDTLRYDGTRLWSRGVDGVDDGARGEFDGPGPDLVIELEPTTAD